jgi:hypothetical protein
VKAVFIELPAFERQRNLLKERLKSELRMRRQ